MVQIHSPRPFIALESSTYGHLQTRSDLIFGPFGPTTVPARQPKPSARKSELLHPMHLELTESDSSLTVRAEVPGFTAKELEINVEPRRLTVTGKRETKDETKKGRTVHSELCASEILRVVELPAEVDISNLIASLKDGILSIKMAKTATPKSVRVELKTT
jgi:HSP20 family protein